MAIQVLDRKLHILDNTSDEVEAKEITTQFDKFIRDIIELININNNVRLYTTRDNTQVVNSIIEIVKTNMENGDYLEGYDKKFNTNAERLIREEKKAQQKIERLKKSIKKGSLIQAVIYDVEEKQYEFLIAKIENKMFFDDITLDAHSGIDGENNKLWKSCLFKFEINEDKDIEITEAKVFSDNGAKYWWDNFLELNQMSDDEKNTKKAFDNIDKVLATNIKPISPSDYFTLRNSLVGHFRSREFFDYEEMMNEVFNEYEPELLNKEVYKGIVEKVKQLPTQKKFDSQFTIVKKVITAKVKKVYNINTGIQLNVVDFIANLKNTIKSYEEDGQKYLKIKIKDSDTNNQELYNYFL